MEAFLNLAWVLMAALMFCLWLRFAPCTGRGGRIEDPRTQFVALAVLLLILFPVISVTDDLQALQNPAETDSTLRKDHVSVGPHSIVPAVAVLPLPVLAELFFGAPSQAANRGIAVAAIDHPALTSIQNRPPPAA